MIAAITAVFEGGVGFALSELLVGASATAVGVDVAGTFRQRIMSDVCYATLTGGAKRFITELENVIVVFCRAAELQCDWHMVFEISE